jgi:excisionase family DNA binding protein
MATNSTQREGGPSTMARTASPAGREADGGGDYLTAGEVARRLHVSPKTVNRWAKGGLINSLVTLGGHRRFHRDDVDAAYRAMERGTR